MNDADQNEKVVKWIEFMKTRLDRYEVERNEFTADYRMPPQNVMFYREVILPFAENTLIMDNLTASEGVRYNECVCQNDLHIRCFVNKGGEIKATYPNLKWIQSSKCIHANDSTPVCYPNFFPYLVQAHDPKNGNKLTLEEAFHNKQIEGDIEICLPSEHAFYSILENFIRNSAKHNKQLLEGKPLEIYISVLEIDDNLYEVNLYDNVSTMPVEKLYGLVEGKRQSLLNKAGELNREKLGIADMKINAHLLRSSQDIENDLLKEHLEIILLQASENEESINRFCDQNQIYSLKKKELNPENKGENIKDFINKNSIQHQYKDLESDVCYYRFGYRFHFAKSKKVCWIGEEPENKETLEKLKKRGIYFFDTWEDYTEQKDGSLAAYQFAILEKDILEKWNNPENDDDRKKLEDKLEKMLLHLPFRVLLNSTDGVKKGSILDEYITSRRIKQVEEPIEIEEVGQAAFKILQNCWENWLRRWVKKDEKASLIMCFEGPDEHEEWKKFCDNTKQVELSSNLYFKLLPPNGKSDSESLNGDNHVIMFDHHGQGLKQLSEGISFETGFYQIIEKGSEDFVPIFYPPNDKNRKILLCFELIEAGLCNIVVVDERLCGNMYDKAKSLNQTKVEWDLKYNNQAAILLAHFGAWAKLWYANRFNKNYSIKPDKSNKMCKFSCSIDKSTIYLKYGKNSVKDQSIDAIIIHRTYLGNNNLPDNDRSDEENKLKKYLSELRKQIPFVVVISGGGYPHGMEGNFKFKPYGIYQRYFSTSMSKYSIVRTTFT